MSDGAATPTAKAKSSPGKKTPSSSPGSSEVGSSPRGDLNESTSYATKARTELVHKVLEGLRHDAFELARDIGVESLTEPGGLRLFIARMKAVVFPRAAEEARELLRAGQKPGVLSRQPGKSMLSYVSRRKRWWKLLHVASRTLWS